MPLDDEKLVEKLLHNSNISKESIKDLIQGIIQRAYYFESELKVHKTVTLKDGKKKDYYVLPIPNDAIKYKKLAPEQLYRVEFYPLEKKRNNNLK